MDAKTYRAAALQFNVDRNPGGNFTHAVYGMITESAELVDIEKRLFAYAKPLDLVHIKEELGDFCWYFNLLLDVLGLTWEEAFKFGADIVNDEGNPENLFAASGLGLVTTVATLASFEYVRHYGEDLPLASRGMYEPVAWTVFYVNAILQVTGLTWEDAFAANIAKLDARFPGRVFTNERAIYRDTDNERAVLEGTGHASA